MEPAAMLLIPLIVLTTARVVSTACTSVVAAGHRFWRGAAGRAIVPIVTVVSIVASLRSPATAATPPPGVRLAAVQAPDTPTKQIHAPRRAGDAPVTWIPDQPRGRSPIVTYEVKSGDSLWRIAKSVLQKEGRPDDGVSVGRLWRAIYERNHDVIGDNPDLIHPGQRFTIPEA